VSAVVPFTGLACGALLAAAGLALWSENRQDASTLDTMRETVRVIRWVAGGLLIVGALLAWQGRSSLSGAAPHLILMAALAAPPEIHRHRLARWARVLPILPALGLAGAGLIWALGTAEASTGSGPITPSQVALTICGGLAARALGMTAGTLGIAEGDVAGSSLHLEWPSRAAYGLLTLIVGGTLLANLWQRGWAWDGTTGERSLAGVWLAWTAAWMTPRRSRRLRAAFTIVAALLLIVLAAGNSMLEIHS
jgi:hypothetical protein